MGYINLGTRNKSTMWTYASAYSFKNSTLPKTKYAITELLEVGEGLPNQHCHHTDDIEVFKKLFVEELSSGLYTKDFFKQIRHSYQDKLKDLEKIVSSNFAKDNNKKLADKFMRAFACVADSHKAMLFGLYTMYLDNYYTNQLTQILSPDEQNPTNIAELKAFLLMTTKTSFVQQEEDILFEIIQAFHQSDASKTKLAFTNFLKQPDIKTKLDHLVRDFGWFHMEYIHNPHTLEDYEHDLWTRANESDTTKLQHPSLIREEIKNKQKQFFADHPDKDFKQLTVAFQELAYILDDTKVVTVKGIFLIRPMLKEIATRLSISLDDLLYLAPPDITKFLKEDKPADPKLIAERKKFRVVYLHNDTIKVFEGSKARALAKKLLPKESEEVTTEVKGVTAYPGKVTGKVTLISSVKDRPKFTKGDVLVTHDGTAELTYFLQGASAIVTNEGGIICHAAIVAREMKTPCLVGTKSATKVFKDGDTIEVDATNSIAKIIKRKE
jgi:phosphohistidine swiveling domain-containing protein